MSFCRHDGRDDVFNVDIGDSVQMIGYNYETGATCFFESGDNSPWTHVGENNRLLGVLPGPDDPKFDDAYVPAGAIQCVRCHQADPFIHNPWIKTARLPENPRQPVVPVLPGPTRLLRRRRSDLGTCGPSHRGQRLPRLPPGRHGDVGRVHRRLLGSH